MHQFRYRKTAIEIGREENCSESLRRKTIGKNGDFRVLHLLGLTGWWGWWDPSYWGGLLSSSVYDD